MILETNYLRFTGKVSRDNYNFAGIGAIHDSSKGHWFASEVIGIRAHIQHLKGYATVEPIKSDRIVDPRYSVLEQLGLLGTSPLVSTLTGRWATSPHYSNSILIILRRMYNYANALSLSEVSNE